MRPRLLLQKKSGAPHASKAPFQDQAKSGASHECEALSSEFKLNQSSELKSKGVPAVQGSGNSSFVRRVLI